jgi:hypothetical protein
MGTHQLNTNNTGNFKTTQLISNSSINYGGNARPVLLVAFFYEQEIEKKHFPEFDIIYENTGLGLLPL